MSRTASLALLALLAAGCASRRVPGEPTVPRAVVLAPAAREAEADRVSRTLAASGYDVTRKTTPIARARSSAGVYGLRDSPERLEEVTELLEGLDLGLEILPFQQRATGGNAVVVWLATPE